MYVSKTGLLSAADSLLNMPVSLECGVVEGICVDVLCAAVSTPLSKNRERMENKKIHLPVMRKDGEISRQQC